MKKVMVILVACSFLAACNGNNSSKSGSPADNTMNSADSQSQMRPSVMDSSMAAAIQEGTMTMKNGKMMVMTAGLYKEMKNPMTCTDGCKVSPDGKVVMKDGTQMRLTEGMSIDKNGNMLDENGKMIPMDDNMMNGRTMMMKDSMK